MKISTTQFLRCIVLMILMLGGTNSAKPIVFTLYTVHKNILKLTAQLEEQTGTYPTKAQLEIRENNQWKQIAESSIVNPGWTVPFKVSNWDMSKDVSFRVKYSSDIWSGVIRKDPIDKDTIIVAAFTGNSIAGGGGLYQGGGDVPKTDIVENVKKHGADLLVFTGDQVYPHKNHLKHWIHFGNDFGELLRDIPCVCLPDDHDVGQGNLFGEGGKKTDGKIEKGGYAKKASYVKQVERAQTSHLPDPYDPTPVQQGIGVYYTAMNLGGISFAIIEDRKFKSGPQGKIPDNLWATSGRADHIAMNTPGYEPSLVDVAGVTMLGQRQLNFLKDWATDWRAAEMKAVLSATIFAAAAHLHGGKGENARLLADLDANGWPQTARNKALTEIRKGFAFMIAGDQHLSTVIHHGIDNWNDAGYSFCVPSIANYYWRYWKPLENGINHLPGKPHTGQFHDGFGNKISVWAFANPGNYGREPKELHDNAPGYGIVRFDKRNRTITMEAWPRYVDPRQSGSKPYDGWPITIKQEDNYGREAVEFLPTLDIKGMSDAVVQVLKKQNNEIVYTLRIKGNRFRPKVFAKGNYTIRVGELNSPDERVISNIQSLPSNQDSTIVINFSVPIHKHGLSSFPHHGKATVTWNRVTQQVHLRLPANDSYLVDIYRANGSMAISRSVKGPGYFMMSIPKLASGTYAVTIKNSTRTLLKKIVAIQ